MGGLLERLLAVTILVTVGCHPSAVAGKSDLPLPEYPAMAGFRDSAVRQFASARELAGGVPAAYLVVAVVEFGTPEQAEAAAGLTVRTVSEEPKASRVAAPVPKPVSAPRFADWSAAFILPPEEVEGGELLPDLRGRADVAFLFVRDGRYFYLLASARLGMGIGAAVPSGDAVADVTAVADALFRRGAGTAPPGPQVDPGYATGPLWDRLPRLEDLPPGYVFLEDLEAERPIPTPPVGNAPKPAAGVTVRGQPQPGEPLPNRLELVHVLRHLSEWGLSVQVKSDTVRIDGIDALGQVISVEGVQAYAFLFPNSDERWEAQDAVEGRLVFLPVGVDPGAGPGSFIVFGTSNLLLAFPDSHPELTDRVGAAVTAMSEATLVGHPQVSASPTGSTTATASVRLRTNTLRGQVVLESDNNVVGEEDGQSACKGGGGYADIIGGEDVAVFNADGEEVSRTQLQLGQPEDNGQTCVFSFLVPELPEAKRYTVEIGNRDPVPYTLKELRESDFRITLALREEP